MNYTYICGGIEFATETEAFEYARQAHLKDGTILGVSRVEVDSDEAHIKLIDAVIRQIQLDVQDGEYAAIMELLMVIPSQNLFNFLSDDVIEEMQNVQA